MPERLQLLVGTAKGLFIFESDRSRRDWAINGPHCEAWPVNHAIQDPATGALLAAGNSPWYGPVVWRSIDGGETWTHSGEGLAYPEGKEALANVWVLHAAHGVLYAGVEPAGLFRSEDGGVTWKHLPGLANHPTRNRWQPGGAGLICHSLVSHPADPKQMWCAISAVGTFYTADGGETWTPQNKDVGLPDVGFDPEVGTCVHHLEMSADDPSCLYQQNHDGMYVSHDGGSTWDDVGAALPSRFGFGLTTHPRDTDTFYIAPLNGSDKGRFMPEGKAAVWKTTDAGKTWSAKRSGLPQEDAFFGVLRQAMGHDTLEPAGIYFGSSSGQLYASADEGESWTQLSSYLPRISSITAVSAG